MKVEVNVTKRYAVLIVGIVLVLAAVIGVIASHTTDTSVNHGINQITGIPTCPAGEVLTHSAAGIECANTDAPDFDTGWFFVENDKSYQILNTGLGSQPSRHSLLYCREQGGSCGTCSSDGVYFINGVQLGSDKQYGAGSVFGVGSAQIYTATNFVSPYIYGGTKTLSTGGTITCPGGGSCYRDVEGCYKLLLWD